VVFSFSEQEITTPQKGSQEDPIPSPPTTEVKPTPLHYTSDLKKIIEPFDFNKKKSIYNRGSQSPDLGNKINDL